MNPRDRDRCSSLPRLRPLTVAMLLALAGTGTPRAVQAQGDQEASERELDRVVVTATRREETAQEVPINITAVTGSDIEERGLKNLADLVRTVPGLFLVNQGGRDANLLTVRGLNVDPLAASEGVGLDGGGVVAQYIGDIPQFLDLRLFDIDRVEALLGPQGTLYGAGTLGGAIRYMPMRPQIEETSFEISGGLVGLSHSSDIGSESLAIANLPLGSQAAFRAAVAHYDDPGFIDYGHVLRQPGVSNPEPAPGEFDANLRRVRDANWVRTLSGRFGFRYDFNDAADLNLTYHYQRDRAGGRTVNHAESFGTDRYESAGRYLEPNTRKSQLLSLEVNADLGFAELTSATGVSNYDELGQRDQTDLLLAFEYGYEDFPSFSSFTRETVDQDRFNQELRLVSNHGGPWNWIVGAFYNRSDLEATSSEFVPGFPEFFDIDRPDNLEYFQHTFNDFKERALFGEIGYDLTDAWTMTVGARRFSFEDEQRVGFALPLIDGSGPDEILPSFETVNVKDSDSIFKFNTAYQFNPDLLGYFTLSEGYRSGGSNAVPPCSDPLEPGQNVCALPNERLIQPDKTRNHEIGIKSSLLDNRLTLNAALYYIEWKDIQVAGTTVNGAIPITVNASEAASRGLELSASARLGAGLRLSAGYSHNQAKLTADAPGIVQGEDAFDGDRLPGSPRHQGNVALNWYRPLANGLAVGADYAVYGQSDIYTRVGLRNGGEVLGGYATHDAAFSLFGDRWSVRFYVRNLFDKFAETGVRDTRDAIYRIDGTVPGASEPTHSFALRRYHKSVLEPRRFGFTVRYSF